MTDPAAPREDSLMGHLQKTGGAAQYNRFDFWLNPTPDEVATLTGFVSSSGGAR